MSIRGLKLTQEILSPGSPLRKYIKAERLPGPDVRTDAEYYDFVCAAFENLASLRGHLPQWGRMTAAVVDAAICASTVSRGSANCRCNSIMPRVDFIEHQRSPRS